MSERPPGAEFLALSLEPVGLLAGVVLPEPVAALLVEVKVVFAVPVLLGCAVADGESVDDEGDGLGHALSYTYCSGAPLQVVVDPASNVPFV